MQPLFVYMLYFTKIPARFLINKSVLINTKNKYREITLYYAA